MPDEDEGHGLLVSVEPGVLDHASPQFEFIHAHLRQFADLPRHVSVLWYFPGGLLEMSSYSAARPSPGKVVNLIVLRLR